MQRHNSVHIGSRENSLVFILFLNNRSEREESINIPRGKRDEQKTNVSQKKKMLRVSRRICPGRKQGCFIFHLERKLLRKSYREAGRSTVGTEGFLFSIFSTKCEAKLSTGLDGRVLTHQKNNKTADSKKEKRSESDFKVGYNILLLSKQHPFA